MDLHWWSIEIRDGALPATAWQRGYGEALTEAAITHGAREWGWAALSWGVVLEIGFADDEAWPRFRDLPAVRAALDAIPDPIHGLYVYPGRGGSSGAADRRHPRRPLGAGAAPMPQEPEPVIAAGHEPAGWQPPLVAAVP